MNPSCLNFALTDQERAAFERDGLLLLENALSPAQVESLTRAADRLVGGAQKQHAIDPEKRLDIRDLLWRDPLFLDLVDWPTTLPKVWGASWDGISRSITPSTCRHRQQPQQTKKCDSWAGTGIPDS